jgi:hypothetical protein
MIKAKGGGVFHRGKCATSKVDNDKNGQEARFDIVVRMHVGQRGVEKLPQFWPK